MPIPSTNLPSTVKPKQPKRRKVYDEVLYYMMTYTVHMHILDFHRDQWEAVHCSHLERYSLSATIQLAIVTASWLGMPKASTHSVK